MNPEATRHSPTETILPAPIYIFFILIAAMLATGCGGRGDKRYPTKDADRRQIVLRAQRLQNLKGEEDCTPEIEAIVDSLAMQERDVYYFAAVNVLIDHLVSRGRYQEANAYLEKLEERSIDSNDRLAASISLRIKGQLHYKLGMPHKALSMLDSASSLTPSYEESLNTLSTSSNINEWKWILSMQLKDTLKAERAAADYAKAVKEWQSKGWRDSTAHFPVTALALEAYSKIIGKDLREAEILLDSAASLKLATLPPNAYEIYYHVRTILASDVGNNEEASAYLDTLISSHENFIWFKQQEILWKSELLFKQRKYEEAYSTLRQYQALADSLSELQIEREVAEMKALYISEQDAQAKVKDYHRRAIAWITGLAILTVFLFLGLSLKSQKEKNRLLVERLKALDAIPGTDKAERKVSSPIEALDIYMEREKPFTNPAMTRKDLAGASGMTEGEVAQLIQEQRGMTVLNYINHWRLEESRQVLEKNPEMPISTIAVHLGFGTPRTFQRLFKSEYQMTPTQYRDIVKNHNK